MSVFIRFDQREVVLRYETYFTGDLTVGDAARLDLGIVKGREERVRGRSLLARASCGEMGEKTEGVVARE